jgi:nickel-type superoxide dismutase maturation protease
MSRTAEESFAVRVLFAMIDATWRERLLYFAGRRKAYLVEGNSMLPTLASGDVVLVARAAAYAEGDVVLAAHPYKKSVKILKRIANLNADGSVSLAGDNPDESTDSRTFGTVPLKCLIGKATCRLK